MADFVAVILGVVLIVVLSVSSVKLREQIYPLIDECEKSLPRDQKCVLIAIPETIHVEK